MDDKSRKGASHSSQIFKSDSLHSLGSVQGAGTSQEEEDKFLNKIHKWSQKERSGWKWDQRPAHRDLTIGAAKAQEKLLYNNAADKSALEDVEKSIMAFQTYATSESVDNDKPADFGQQVSGMQDLMRVKELSKRKAIAAVAEKEDELKRRAEEEVRAIEAQLAVSAAGHNAASQGRLPGSLIGGKVGKAFDPDMLASVRRHNAFRQRMVEARSHAVLNDKEAATFKALPMPGYVPRHARNSDNAGYIYHNETPRSELSSNVDSLQVMMQEHQAHGGTRKPASLEDTSFFVTGGDFAKPEASSESDGPPHSSDQSSDDDSGPDLDEEELRLEIARQQALISRQQSARAKEQQEKPKSANAAIYVDSIPSSSLKKTTSLRDIRQDTSDAAMNSGRSPSSAQLSSRTDSSRSRRSSRADRNFGDIAPRPRDFLRDAEDEDVGLLDLDQLDRQQVWMQRKEQKRQQLQRELDLKAAEQLRSTPSMKEAKESWERAKREHDIEVRRQRHNEEMRQKMQDLQAELQVLRLEQRVRELKQKAETDKLKAAIAAASGKGGRPRRRRGGTAGDGSSRVSDGASYIETQSSLQENGDSLSFLDSMQTISVGPTSLPSPKRVASASKAVASEEQEENKLPRARGKFTLSKSDYVNKSSGDADRCNKDNFANMSALDLLSGNASSDDAFAARTGDGVNIHDPEDSMRRGNSREGRAVESGTSQQPYAGDNSNSSLSSTSAKKPLGRRHKKPPTLSKVSNVEVSRIPGVIEEEGADDDDDASLLGERLVGGDGCLVSSMIGGQPPSSMESLGSQVSDSGFLPFSVKTTPRASAAVGVSEPGRNITYQDETYNTIGSSNNSDRDASGTNDGLVKHGGGKSGAKRVSRQQQAARLASLAAPNPYKIANPSSQSSQKAPQGGEDAFIGKPKPLVSPYAVDLAASLSKKGGGGTEHGDASTPNATATSSAMAGATAKTKRDPLQDEFKLLQRKYGHLTSGRKASDSGTVDRDEVSGANEEKAAGIGGRDHQIYNHPGAYPDLNDPAFLTPVASTAPLHAASYKEVVADARSFDTASIIDQYRTRIEAIGTLDTPAAASVIPSPDAASNSSAATASTDEAPRPIRAYAYGAPSLLTSTSTTTTAAVPGPGSVSALSTATVPNSSSTSIITGKFFDSSSTEDKGRFRVNDARDFHTKSLSRCPDPFDEGVTLLLGVRRKPNAGLASLSSDVGAAAGSTSGGSGTAASSGFDGPEEVITILFDRSQFSEDRARAWWQLNRDRIINFSR